MATKRHGNGATQNERRNRVSQSVQRILGAALTRGVLRDPRLRDVVITDVRVTPDLQDARVYIRCLNDQADEETIVRLMTGAAPKLRHELGQQLAQRFTPRLQFFWDSLVESAARIEGLLADIADEKP